MLQDTIVEQTSVYNRIKRQKIKPKYKQLKLRSIVNAIRLLATNIQDLGNLPEALCFPLSLWWQFSSFKRQNNDFYACDNKNNTG